MCVLAMAESDGGLIGTWLRQIKGEYGYNIAQNQWVSLRAESNLGLFLNNRGLVHSLRTLRRSSGGPERKAGMDYKAMRNSGNRTGDHSGRGGYYVPPS